MNPTRQTLTVLLLLGALWLGVGLVGCGKKGPLYLPDESTAASH